MDTIVQRCAGLDVHKNSVMATVRVPDGAGGRAQQTRRYGTMTRQVAALGDWLAGFGVTRVGMEATGVYWKPVFYGLEDDFECWLLNAQHLKNVPGRKTDVADSVWICQLVEHGLVRPSFVPPRPIRQLRNLTRSRKAVIEERNRIVQRLDKTLQDAGLKVNSVTATTLGVSTRHMLEALCAGQRDPIELAELARGRLRSKIPQLREALTGRFDAHHAVMITQLLAHIDTLDASIAAYDAEVEAHMAPYAAIRELVGTIPGVGRRLAETLIAECGVDMSIFPTPGHLASWAGVCPGNNESAGRHKSGHTRPGPKWLRTALTEAAKAAARSKGTYLAAHHAQIRGRRGQAKATGATRHDILIAYYHIVRDQVAFRELGADWAARHNSVEHRTRRLVAQLEKLGHTVTLETAHS